MATPAAITLEWLLHPAYTASSFCYSDIAGQRRGAPAAVATIAAPHCSRLDEQRVSTYRPAAPNWKRWPPAQRQPWPRQQQQKWECFCQGRRSRPCARKHPGNPAVATGPSAPKGGQRNLRCRPFLQTSVLRECALTIAPHTSAPGVGGRKPRSCIFERRCVHATASAHLVHCGHTPDRGAASAATQTRLCRSSAGEDSLRPASLWRCFQ